MRSFLRHITLLGSAWFAFVASVTAQSYTVTTIAGLAGVSGAADGTNSTARFYRPSGLAVDGAGNIYVADHLNHTIRKIAPAGTNWVVSTLAGLAGTLGSADGTNDQARFNQPHAVAVDTNGDLFVTDNYNQTIRKITRVGTNWVVSTVAGVALTKGSDDGTNSQARFNSPEAIAVDSSGRLYVTDRLNFTVREVSPSGTNWVTSTLAGTASIYGGFVDGPNGDAEFNLPWGIARHSGGNLYVADWGNNAIRRISPVGPDWVTSTVAGFSGARGTNDGPASQAKFYSPNGIAVDASETLYVTDQYNHTIRKIALVGNSWVVSTVAGLAGQAGSADGTGTSARFAYPWGIALDGAQGFYVADEVNNTIRWATPALAPSPVLHMLLASNQVVLSWSTAAGNFVLETTPALGTGAFWVGVTNGVSVSGNDYSFTNVVGPAPAFFRLRGP
jgi:sugar lactone lactonase YvrE